MASTNNPSSSSDSSSGSESRSSIAVTSATPPTFYDAAHAVLDKNELLCKIIGHLLPEDIFVTTGVCKTWHYALKASVAIQQALFLAPTSVRQITTITKDIPERIEDIPREPCVVYAIVGEINPFVARIFDPLLSTADSISQLQTMSPRRNFEHPAGLWREMFITQPPISLVRVCLCPSPPVLTAVFPPWFMAEYLWESSKARGKTDSLQCGEGLRLGSCKT